MKFLTSVSFLLLLLLSASAWSQINTKQNPVKPNKTVASPPVEPVKPVQVSAGNAVGKSKPIEGQTVLDWGKPFTDKLGDNGQEVKFLNCKLALYRKENHYLPEYFKHIKLNANSNAASVTIENAKYEELTAEELKVLGTAEKYVTSDVVPKVKIVTDRKELYVNVVFTPLRKNATTGTYEKLVSFSLNIHESKQNIAKNPHSAVTFVKNSVLSSGTWYRIGVPADGIYKLSYTFFKRMGIDMATLVPANIRIFGNGGAMLPQSNAVYRPDDLLENAIYVNGQNDTAFKTTDYVLFYGQSPNVWTYGADNHFHHTVNLYSDSTYYYINIGSVPGKRISTENSSLVKHTDSVTTFDDYAYHELDGKNLINSGSEWFGEYFEATTQYTIPFNFPNISNSCVYVNTVMASRNIGYNTQYSITCGTSSTVLTVPGVSGVFTEPYAAMGSDTLCAQPTSSLVSVTITKSPVSPSTSAIGWLYYVEVNARRQLTMGTQNQMEFRDNKSAGAGKTALYNISSIAPIQIWDVSNLQNVSNVTLATVPGGYQFTLPSDTMKEFIAFTGKAIDSAVYFGKVANQNLHADNQADLVIISNPMFLAQAERLANFHRNHDNLKVNVSTTQQVYNEFSSGRQDPTAIRDYMRMLYDRAGNSYDSLPKYLLLFGEGSFDPKNRLSGNTNYVVAYESAESFNPTGSYVADDYYVLLDSNVTTPPDQNEYPLNLSVGRIPADNVTEAQACVNKIIAYETPSGQPDNSTPNCCNTQSQYNLANWRNTVCFIAHDGNGNLFQGYTETIANFVKNYYPNLNVNKIYLDAYQMVQTPGGARYPSVNIAIDNQMNQGLLIYNYEGHGGPGGLALERVLDFSDIYSWTNANALPLFFNASCAFGEWDNPLELSGGALSVTIPTGGVIGMMSAVREVYASGNAALNDAFFNVLYNKLPDGTMPRLGDLLTNAKNATYGTSLNNLMFCLLGDPAVRLSYPQYRVYTTSINSKPVIAGSSDTLKALAKVTISGYVGDTAGNQLNNFNGLLNPTVFDKPDSITTLDNLGGANSPPYTFGIQNSQLYKGMVSVNNGKFSFTYVMPKDILYYYGYGKISYYAQNGRTDATGNYEKIVVGGTSPTAHNNGMGPRIRLYMNDSNFAYGGLTNQNPSLFAIVFDSNGVNTTGTSIGHNITAVLDNNTSATYDLTSYYQPSLNSYQRGTITFTFSCLPNGTHTVSLRVWNVYDNTSQSATEFNVEPQSSLQLQHVLNYPDPFTTHTQFFFEINEVCDVMDVQIQIFSVSGKLVRNILTSVKTDSFRSQPIDWDGRDDYGDRIGKGVYIYHLKVRTSTGTTADTYQKLVIL